MDIEFKPLIIVNRWSTRKNTYAVEQRVGFDRVLVDGDQVGLVPSDPNDPNYRVLHQTLTNCPVQILDMVVKNSNGRLTSYLSMPYKPEPETEDEYDDDE